jgi:hypothetical protein
VSKLALPQPTVPYVSGVRMRAVRRRGSLACKDYHPTVLTVKARSHPGYRITTTCSHQPGVVRGRGARRQLASLQQSNRLYRRGARCAARCG